MTAHTGIAQADVTLSLNSDGVIRKAASSSTLSGEDLQQWVGLSWADTVADGEASVRKIKGILDDVASDGVSAFRQITQRFPSGLQLPVEYTTIAVSADKGLIAVGKNLQTAAELQSRFIATQQAMERDYWKLRDIETRYRLVLDTSSEVVILMSQADLSILEINPAAMATLGYDAKDVKKLVGQNFIPTLNKDEQTPFQTMLQRVSQQGKAPGVMVHLGEARIPHVVRASLMNVQSGPAYLLQLAAMGPGQAELGDTQSLSTDQLIERSPDGFVVMDRRGNILKVNAAFLELAQLSSDGEAIGESLGRWLGRPGADVTVLLGIFKEHKVVRLFATTLHGELGTDTAVELSAASNTDDDPDHIGVMIRDVSRRITTQTNGDDRLSTAMRGRLEQVGKKKLKDLIGTTVSAVERHYIETALELTSGNRTAAAELLGVSRQSLYAKLNRYGLEADAQT